MSREEYTEEEEKERKRRRKEAFVSIYGKKRNVETLYIHIVWE
jgi:hypothetical protein